MEVQTGRLAYDAREVQQLLFISRATFYRMIETGRLPSFRIGRSIRISRTALERFIKNREDQNRRWREATVSQARSR